MSHICGTVLKGVLHYHIEFQQKNLCSDRYQYAASIVNIQYQFNIKIRTPQIKSCSSKNSQDLVQQTQLIRYV